MNESYVFEPICILVLSNSDVISINSDCLCRVSLRILSLDQGLLLYELALI